MIPETAKNFIPVNPEPAVKPEFTAHNTIIEGLIRRDRLHREVTAIRTAIVGQALTIYQLIPSAEAEDSAEETPADKAMQGVIDIEDHLDYLIDLLLDMAEVAP